MDAMDADAEAEQTVAGRERQAAPVTARRDMLRAADERRGGEEDVAAWGAVVEVASAAAMLLGVRQWRWWWWDAAEEEEDAAGGVSSVADVAEAGGAAQGSGRGGPEHTGQGSKRTEMQYCTQFGLLRGRGSQPQP